VQQSAAGPDDLRGERRESASGGQLTVRQESDRDESRVPRRVVAEDDAEPARIALRPRLGNENDDPAVVVAAREMGRQKALCSRVGGRSLRGGTVAAAAARCGAGDDGGGTEKRRRRPPHVRFDAPIEQHVARIPPRPSARSILTLVSLAVNIAENRLKASLQVGLTFCVPFVVSNLGVLTGWHGTTHEGSDDP
jgi:hypothetical protein